MTPSSPGRRPNRPYLVEKLYLVYLAFSQKPVVLGSTPVFLHIHPLVAMVRSLFLFHGAGKELIRPLAILCPLSPASGQREVKIRYKITNEMDDDDFSAKVEEGLGWILTPSPSGQGQPRGWLNDSPTTDNRCMDGCGLHTNRIMCFVNSPASQTDRHGRRFVFGQFPNDRGQRLTVSFLLRFLACSPVSSSLVICTNLVNKIVVTLVHPRPPGCKSRNPSPQPCRAVPQLGH